MLLRFLHRYAGLIALIAAPIIFFIAAVAFFIPASVTLWLALTVFFIALLAVSIVLLLRLGSADEQAAVALADKQGILDATRQAVFTIDRNFQIGSMQSTVTAAVFGMDQPLEGNLLEILKPSVRKKELESAREYLSLLLDDKQHEDFLTKFKPLQRVKILLDPEHNEAPHRYLNFTFVRSERVDEPCLLVAVNDVTRETDLQHELQEISESSQARYRVLMGNIEADSETLADFFREAYGQLQQINDLLRGSQAEQIDNTRKLDWIGQRAEVVRERAGVFNMALIEASTARLIDDVEKLQDLPEVDSKQLLALTANLNRIIRELELIEELTSDFNSVSSHNFEEIEAQSEALTQSLQNHNLEQIVNLKNMALKLAEQNRKIVNLEVYGFPELPLRPGALQEIQSVCMQLIRNAVKHGIEDPYARQQLNKPATGQIVLALREMDDEKLLLTLRDDGAGLDLKSVLTKAVDKGLIDKKDAQDISPTKIVRFLFKPGFSSGEHSKGGSGYGLDIVKTSVKGLGGSIGVKTQRHEYTQVSITLPRAVLDEQAQ